MTTSRANAARREAAAGPARITDRLAELRALDGARLTLTPPVPRSAKIELTSRCDYGCRFCALHLRPQAPADMPWSLYTRIARELREAGVEQVGLFYVGESLLYPRLEDAVRYAKEACGYPYVFLTTNGRIATAARVARLMRAGLDSLKFALNFADDEELAQRAGITDGIEAVVRNVLDACELRDASARTTGHRCRVSASSLNYDEGQPARMAPLLARLAPRLDEHYWLPVYGRADAARGPHNPSRKALPCWSLFAEAHVTVAGRLSACPLDHSPRFGVGDLTERSFEEAWASREFQALRAAHLAGEARGTACERCVAYD